MRTTDTPNVSGRASARAFTLIELLTVVSIIGILAGVAMPAMQNAIGNAKASSAMQQARQIALGLRTYAQENGEVYPVGENSYGEPIDNANAAFRELYDYIDNENVYAVKGSRWGAEADGKMDTPSEYVRAGENHFAYVAGLTTSSKSDWPLIVDGTDGNGTYSTDRSVRGGLRQGKRGIVVFCDGSGTVEKLGQPSGGGARFLKRSGHPMENALDVSYMGSEVELLDPAS